MATSERPDLPDLAQDFAADTLLARLPSGHYPAGCGQNINAQPTQDARDLTAPHINPATRPGDTLDVGDRGFVVVAIFQIDAQDLLPFLLRSFEVGDVPFLFEDACNLQLQLGSGNIHFLVPGANRVANACQHVCDRIGQPHRLLLLRRPFAVANLQPAEKSRDDVRRGAGPRPRFSICLPGRLRNPGNFSAQRQATETQAADTELAQISAWASAQVAAVVLARRKLGLPCILHSFCCSGQFIFSSYVVTGRAGYLAGVLPAYSGRQDATRGTACLDASAGLVPDRRFAPWSRW